MARDAEEQIRTQDALRETELALRSFYENTLMGLYYDGTVEDITERKIAELRLHASLEKRKRFSKRCTTASRTIFRSSPAC
jgi:hypothetical protein